MPEIVEIKKYCDFIKKHLNGVSVTAINILDGRYKKHGPFKGFKELQKALPMKIRSVDTKSKLTWMTFENGYKLLVTLGLMGGWAYKSKNGTLQFPKIYDTAVAHEGPRRYQVIASNHLNVELSTTSGSVFYYDTLSFGTLKVLKTDAELARKLRTIGPDIMDSDTTLAVFKERLGIARLAQKSIGIVLLDQKVVSGIGNYLRADVLYMSGISPFRKVNDVTQGELKKLYSSVKALTWGLYDRAKGIQLGYITKHTKLPSDHGRIFYVYDCETDILGNPVTKERLYEGSQKRSIYWVKAVQK